MIEYLVFVVMYGDYLNDWLTHLPVWLQPVALGLGRCIAAIL